MQRGAFRGKELYAGSAIQAQIESDCCIVTQEKTVRHIQQHADAERGLQRLTEADRGRQRQSENCMQLHIYA